MGGALRAGVDASGQRRETWREMEVRTAGTGERADCVPGLGAGIAIRTKRAVPGQPAFAHGRSLIWDRRFRYLRGAVDDGIAKAEVLPEGCDARRFQDP